MSQHPMRRFKQTLSTLEIEDILKRGKTGVLALIDEANWPYAIPLNYVFHDGHLYFHGASKGHKMEAIAYNPRASFCVVDQDDIVPEHYSTAYSSVIAFGKMRLIEDPQEKKNALLWLCEKYCPLESLENQMAEIEKSPHVCILSLDIEQATGKGGREFFLRRQKEQELLKYKKRDETVSF